MYSEAYAHRTQRVIYNRPYAVAIASFALIVLLWYTFLHSTPPPSPPPSPSPSSSTPSQDKINLNIPPKTPHLALVPKQLAILLVPSHSNPQRKTLFKLATRTWIHNTAHLNVSYLLPLARDVAHIPSPFVKLVLANHNASHPMASLLLSAVDTLAKEYSDSFDWIMRVQESTFVRVDKMVQALQQTPLNASEPWLIGHVHGIAAPAAPYKQLYTQPSCQVMPGYILSKGLLKQLKMACLTMATPFKNADGRLFECMRRNLPQEFVGCRGLTNHTRWTRFLSPLSPTDYQHIDDAWYVIKHADTLHGASYGNALTIGGLSKDMYSQVENLYGIHGKYKEISGMVGRQST